MSVVGGALGGCLLVAVLGVVACIWYRERRMQLLIMQKVNEPQISQTSAQTSQTPAQTSQTPAQAAAQALHAAEAMQASEAARAVHASHPQACAEACAKRYHRPSRAGACAEQQGSALPAPNLSLDVEGGNYSKQFNVPAHMPPESGAGGDRARTGQGNRTAGADCTARRADAHENYALYRKSGHGV